MNRRRAPHPLLRPFVREVWSCAAEPAGEAQARIERLLPSGFMHLVLRLDESPVRLPPGTTCPWRPCWAPRRSDCVSG
jgi:hypothetical protein